MVSQSAAFGDTNEDATLFDPPAGRYTAHVVNYDQVPGPFDDWSGEVRFRSPSPNIEGTSESWTFTCQPPKGSAGAPQQITVDRGQVIDLGAACGNAASLKR